MAHDKRLDREVAIKELLQASGDHTTRFAREALVTARLAHPAIVPVYEAGVWPDGAPFFAMKLVAGRSLEAVVRGRGALAERLALLPHVIDVAEALAFAHGKRIIHRDLKPANVLVGDFGETVVIDWGLAKDLSDAAPDLAPAPTYRITDGHTVVGAVMGTPAYMPPEQAFGNPVDERADVYALGALLYHVLAGEPPYLGTSSQDIILQVIKDPPSPLLDKEPGVPADLLAIVRKAMARDPDDRYPTARELAEDLNKFQRGQLVGAHEYSLAARLWRWLRRNRAPVVVAAAMLAVLVVGGVLSVRRIVQERDVARAQRAELARLKEAADEKGDLLALREAEAELPRDPHRALAWLKQLSPANPRWGAARVLAADAVARGVPRAVISGEGARFVRFSPDGKILAEARGADVVLRDMENGQTQLLRRRAGDERALVWSADGAHLAFGGENGVVRVWDRRVSVSAERRGHAKEVRALAFAADGRLASAAADGTVRVWPAEGGEPRVFTGEAEVTALAWAPGAARLGWIAEGKLRMWDGGAGPAVTVEGPGRAAALSFTPDGQSLIVVSADGAVARAPVDGKKPSPLGTLPAAPSQTSPSQDGGWLAVGDEGGGVTILAATGGARRFALHDGAVTALVFSAEGTRLVTGGRDRAVHVLQADGGVRRDLLGHEGEIVSLALGPGRALATVARDGTLRLWDLGAGEARDLGGVSGPARALAAGERGEIAVASDAGVWLWRAADAAPVRVLDAPVRALAFARGGGTLYALGSDGGVRAVAVTGGETREIGSSPRAALLAVGLRELAVAGPEGITVLDGRGGTRALAPGAQEALAWSPGGTLLAAAARTGVVLWRSDGRGSQALDPEPATAVAVSGDGHWVASGGAYGVRIFRVANGAKRDLDGGAAVTSLLFSPDGKRLAALGTDHTIRVWEVAGDDAGRLLTVGAVSAAFSPDGGELAVVGVDGGVRVVDAATGTARALRVIDARAAAFLADGSGVVVAGSGGSVRLFPDAVPHDPEALRAWLAGSTDAEVGK